MIASREDHVTRSLVSCWAALVVAAIATFACTRGEDAPRIPLAQAPAPDTARAVEAAPAPALIGPAARAALDSGNAFFRRKSYAAALVQYRVASALAPGHAAPLFGIYMVARATNNAAMADSALDGIRQRSGPMSPVPHMLTDSALRRVHKGVGKKSPAS
jgi:hypothetical protein